MGLAGLVVSSSLVALAGCGGGKVLSADEVKAHGVLILRTSPPKAFKASLEALKQLGYEIAVEDLEHGLIVTKRKSLPDLSVANNTTFMKQYTIEVRDAGGASRITATPAIFAGDVDASSRKLWDLDGPLGERELWKQLFAKIEQLQ